MLSIGLVITGVSFFAVGAGLLVACFPPSEKEQIEKAYQELELQKKKEALIKMCNADINLFGLLKY